jgi:CDP-diacylglycerol pyrophosphatase
MGSNTKEFKMKAAVKVVLLSSVVATSSGCAGGITSAIKAYAVTAEEQASVMKVTFERCLAEQDQTAKDAMCNSVKSSIEAYRQSASELKSIKTSN